MAFDRSELTFILSIYIVSICQSTTSNKSTGTKKMGKGEGGLGVREKVIDRSIRIWFVNERPFVAASWILSFESVLSPSLHQIEISVLLIRASKDLRIFQTRSNGSLIKFSVVVSFRIRKRAKRFPISFRSNQTYEANERES